MKTLKNLTILAVVAVVVAPMAALGHKEARKLARRTVRRLADGENLRLF